MEVTVAAARRAWLTSFFSDFFTDSLLSLNVCGLSQIKNYKFHYSGEDATKKNTYGCRDLEVKLRSCILVLISEV